MDGKKESENNSSGETGDDKICFIKKELASLKEIKDFEIKKSSNSRENKHKKLDKKWDIAVANYKKVEKEYLELYKKGSTTNANSLAVTEISLEKAKANLNKIGKPKDLFALQGKKISYQIEVDHALRSLDAMEILQKKDSNMIDGKELEKQIRWAKRNKTRNEKFLSKPDVDALNKLRKKRMKSIDNKELTAIAREVYRAKNAALDEEIKKRDIAAGRVSEEEVVAIIPNWLVLLLGLLLIIMLGSIVTVFVIGIVAWYALLIIMPTSIIGFVLGQRYSLPE